jgi:hypothetical protein
MNEEKKVPKGALRFIDQGCHAHVELAEGEKVPKLKMVAYSGGVIKDHWYWDDLVIDLEGIKFTQTKYPVLEDHMTDRKIAVIGKPLIEDGKLIAPENAKFLSTEESKEFQKLSQEGFPYQSSIYAKPKNVERLEDDATAKVNGFTLKGPASIWRQCEFKEMSVCVFGADSKTRASAFSREETEPVTFQESSIPADAGNVTNGKEVTNVMNKDELMEKYSDLVKEVVDEAVGKVESKFSTERDELKAELATEKGKNDEMSDRVISLEKNDVIRQEREFKSLADSIWARNLAESAIPVHLHEKVGSMIKYSKFVKDEKFDETGFAEAITVEIKDWEDKGVTETAIGTGFSEKEVDGKNAQVQAKEEENKSIVSRLVDRSGVKVPKED